MISGYSGQLNVFMMFIMQYTLYVADSLAANENHTLWFLIFVKRASGSVPVYVVD